MTENEYVNKQAILDAIMAAEPKEDNYQLVSSKDYVCETVFVKAHNLWQNIVDIIEAAQPTECKTVVHAYWIKHDTSAKCSNCRQKIDRLVSQYYSFCPFCSADMRQESEEKE